MYREDDVVEREFLCSEFVVLIDAVVVVVVTNGTADVVVTTNEFKRSTTVATTCPTAKAEVRVVATAVPRVLLLILGIVKDAINDERRRSHHCLCVRVVG